MEFTLERWNTGFIDDVAEYANNEGIAKWLRDVFPFPYTHKDAEEFVTAFSEIGDDVQLARAIVSGGRAVGSVGIFPQKDVYKRSGELGYWLAEPYWGKGIMTSAVKKLCAEAFERYDIVRIYAEPYADNKGSRRVLEKAGFELEGVLKDSVFKRGQMHDSCVYALLK